MGTMRTAAPLLFAALVGCGGGFTDDDTTANTVAARTESGQLSACAQDDAGSCSPAYVRASAALAYCANARELAAHGKPAVPGPAGMVCPHP